MSKNDNPGDNDYQGYEDEPDEEPDFVDDGSGLPDFLQAGNEGTNLDDDSEYDFDDTEFQAGADEVELGANETAGGTASFERHELPSRVG